MSPQNLAEKADVIATKGLKVHLSWSVAWDL